MDKAMSAIGTFCGVLGVIAFVYFAMVFVVALGVGHATGSDTTMALSVVGLVGLIAVFIWAVMDLDSGPSNISFLRR